MIPVMAAFGIATMPVVTHAGSAAENTIQCQPLHYSSSGVNMGADRSSYKFSNEAKGNVGIAIYGGQDLKKTGYTPEQIGAYLVKQVEMAQGIDAECFIHNEEMPRGSSILFTVNGLNLSLAAITELTYW